MKNIDLQLTSSPLLLDNAYDFVLDETCGGICIFVGTVRNHNKGEIVTHLDFESYKPMAISELSKIAQKAIQIYDLKRIAIHHRTGYVGIKDKAVIIAVSTPHRQAAFDACQYAIDTLKETVPIWKKEHLEDGSFWVNARP